MIITMSRRRLGAVIAAAFVLATVGAAIPAGANHSSLDPTFDGDGRLEPQLHSILGTALAVQPDGKVLASASGILGQTFTALVRYRDDGSSDPTFGTGGRVTIPEVAVQVILLQPDGRIVVAGTATANGGDFAALRFLTDGSSDTSFGTGGRTIIGFDAVGVSNDYVAGAALLPDGKIVLGGISGSGRAPFGPALVRLDAGGKPDVTFDGDGKVSGFGPSGAGVAAVAVQPDGRIVAAGSVSSSGTTDLRSQVALFRFTATGALDPTFDGDGHVAGPDGLGKSVAVQPDGKIVVGGASLPEGGLLAGASRFLLLRFGTDGTVDRTFDTAGAVAGGFASRSSVEAIALRPSGGIAAAGVVTQNDATRVAVAVYDRAGALDPSFDGDGRATTAFPPKHSSATDVALQPDGKIVIAGLAFSGGRPNDELVLARFLASAPPHQGYWLVAADGGVFAFGGATFHGSTGAIRLARPIVGMAGKPGGDGYWLVASDGGVFAFGGAAFHGSTGAIRLARPIVGMAATPSGKGYWLVASDGGVFAFGDATFHGSTGAIRLARPIVGMAATSSGKGYWLVASDGGVFAFGDAPFHGSTGAIRLVSPVVGIAADAEGGGYRLAAADGGVFAFGAEFLGSTGGQRLNRPIVGMAGNSSYSGYWLTASDGGIFAFGPPFAGSTGAITLASPIVGMAARE